MDTNSRLNVRAIAAVGAGHFLVDLYQNTLPPLMPLIGERLGLSLTAAGLVVAVASFTSSLLQPLFGYLSDRGMSNVFLVPGIIWIVLVMSWLYWAPGFPVLLMIAALGGLGGAMYHPQGSVATSASSGPHKGLGIAVYSTAGNLGYTLSPLFIISIVSFLSGPAAYATILVPGLVGVVLMLVAGVHRIAPVKVDRAETPGDVWRFLRTSAGRRLLNLSLIVCARAWTLSSLVVFIPHLLARQGHSTMMAGAILTVFLMSGTVCGMFGGALSDRLGRIRTIAGSTAIGAVVLLGGLLVPGGAGLALLIAGGGVFQASFPATIAFAQETSPRHAAMASGMMMGFGWGVGGILVAGTGALADAIGIVAALTVAVMIQLPVCSWLVRWRTSASQEEQTG